MGGRSQVSDFQFPVQATEHIVLRPSRFLCCRSVEQRQILYEATHINNPVRPRLPSLRETSVESGICKKLNSKGGRGKSRPLSGFLVIRGPEPSHPTCYSLGGLGSWPAPASLWSGLTVPSGQPCSSDSRLENTWG